MYYYRVNCCQNLAMHCASKAESADQRATPPHAPRSTPLRPGAQPCAVIQNSRTNPRINQPTSQFTSTTMSSAACIFCKIIKGRSHFSLVYYDILTSSHRRDPFDEDLRERQDTCIPRHWPIEQGTQCASNSIFFFVHLLKGINAS